MPIFNVTASGFDHVCPQESCGKAQQGVPLSRMEIGSFQGKTILSFLSCDEHSDHSEGYCGSDHGCTVHAEHFQALPAWEETSPTRDEASREQVRNIRLLHKHLGLPVK